jgi:hypothetical protein
MSSPAPLAVQEHAELQRALAEWAALPEAEQLAWDGAHARARFVEAVSPGLLSNGVVRLRLLEAPEHCSVAALEQLLRRLSQHLGFLVPQSHRNELVSRIHDHGKDYGSPATRGHETNANLAFHSDRSDLNLLLYVRSAVAGGRLSIVSFEDAAAALEREAPQALERLFGLYPFDLRDERIFGDAQWYERPILWNRGQGLRGHYIRRFIVDSQRHPEAPRLDAAQLDALDALDGVLERLRSARSFLPRPGELLVLNNYRVMHARERYTDAPTEGDGRLAIRTWVAPFDSEELPDFLRPISGAVSAGCFRGGVGTGSPYLTMLGRTQSPLERVS